MTENGSGPADHFFTDVKFRAMRAGGAQLPGGRLGGGRYDRRWNATLAQALAPPPWAVSSSCSPTTCGEPTALDPALSG